MIIDTVNVILMIMICINILVVVIKTIFIIGGIELQWVRVGAYAGGLGRESGRGGVQGL